MIEPIFDYITNFKNPIMWKGIVIHHSLTKDSIVVDWESIRRYHKGLGWDDIGYHSGIELISDAEGKTKYEYKIGRPLDMQGAHTLGKNDSCIGICLVGNYDIIAPNEIQLFLTASLCRAYMTRFGIPIENIWFHRDFADKSCPGYLFNKLDLRTEIKG